MKKKILIISYTFPPNDGIGGRRWAKFAKYLFRKGVDIRVISTELNAKVNGLWSNDIVELKDDNRINYISSNFPSVLNSYPNTLIGKLRYRFSLFYLRKTIKGNYYDRTSFWKRTLLKEVKTLIGKDYLIIIATGAPFHYLNDLMELKKINPDLKIIVDLRDPWVWGKNYGIDTLDNKQLAEEIKIQDNVIVNSSFITVPVIKMQSDLREFYPEYFEKIHVLEHGYDQDDMPEKLINCKPNNKKLKLIYTGSVYDNLELHFALLNDALSSINESALSISFYTNADSNNKKYFALPNIKRFSNVFLPVTPRMAMHKINEADYFLALYPDKFKDHVSTKFPEIVKLRTPIIYIGKKGGISDFILTHKLGIHIEVHEIQEKLIPIFNGEQFIPYNPTIEVESLSIEKITNNLIRMIELK